MVFVRIFLVRFFFFFLINSAVLFSSKKIDLKTF